MARKTLPKARTRRTSAATPGPKSPHADAFMRVWQLYKRACQNALGDLDADIHATLFALEHGPDFGDRLAALEEALTDHLDGAVTVRRSDVAVMRDASAEVARGLGELLSTGAVQG
jgi:hypothetical protein